MPSIIAALKLLVAAKASQRLRQLKARIGKLQNWLKEEQGSTTPTTLADYIHSILSRKAQVGK